VPAAQLGRAYACRKVLHDYGRLVLGTPFLAHGAVAPPVISKMCAMASVLILSGSAPDDDGNELATNIRYDLLDTDIRAHARCSLLDSGERKSLGTTPPEVIDDRSIPKRMFLTGSAHDEFSADFIKYTSCLDAKTPQVEDELEADHYVAIPEGTEFPGCQETLSCFEPYSLKIKVGDVVSFRNFGSVSHTVTSGFWMIGPDGEFDSGVMDAGDRFLHKFTDADEYDYYCILHQWKAGKIIVHE